MTGGTVLVTGAAGFVGAEVTARLAASGHAVVALLHRTPEIVRNSGRRLRLGPEGLSPAAGAVSWISADVTEPRFGLSRADFAALRDAAGLVVHSAAVTDFGRESEVYEKVNVGGTSHVLALVRGPGIPLVHVSTAYVCGEHDGPFGEADLNVGQRFGNDYERSKFGAEVLVREAAAAGLPLAVVRPSIVVGAERTGVAREFKNMYLVVKVLTEGRVRAIPGDYDATLDLVPVDYVADVVAEAARRPGDAAGGTFHAVSGRPLTLRDFSDVMAEYPSFLVPRYVPVAGFDPARLPPGERAYFERVVSLYQSYFRRRTRFTNEAALALVGRRPALRGRTFLRRLFDFCLRVGYLGAPLPGVDEVLAGLAPEKAGTR